MKKHTQQIAVAFFTLIPIILIGFFVLPDITFAQDGYTLLEPVDILYEGKDVVKYDGLSDFLNSWLRVGITIAGIAAVFMIIWGGVTYMTTDAAGQKSEGKSKIVAAIGGLILALTSWAILNTINPQLLNSDIQFKVDIGGEGEGLEVFLETIPGAGASNGPAEILNESNSPIVDETDFTSGRTLNGIPLAGSYNPTLQKVFGGNGREMLAEKVEYEGRSYVGGRMSTFGGPTDTGVSATETGALYPDKKLREIDPNQFYIAGRWNYEELSVSELRNAEFEAVNPKTGQVIRGIKAIDWGPNPRTRRTWDVSPGVANSLGLKTDDEILIRIVK